jgi:hypothetical protein
MVQKIVVALVGAFVFAALVFSLAPSTRANADRLNLFSTYLVDRLTDANPAGGGEGTGLAGDLRYAITNAQSGDTITFNVTGTINLAGALPVLSRDVRIEGPGANSLTVHGGGGSVFAVASGATVVISGLTITGGVGNGGGIFNQGTLTLNNAAVSGNVAGDPTNGGGTGAGIWNYLNATLTLNSCTVSGNSARGNLSYNPSRGGGIANDGTLTVNNSTISGNSATQGFGGGISNSLGTSALTLNNSTVSGNSATGASGGIDNRGTLNARNTIFANNTVSDLSGALSSQGHNLIGNTTGGSGFVPTDLLNVNPQLGPLQDNGGPTLTMEPSPGSPAINAGDNTGAPAFDERGAGFPRIIGGTIDIGALEVQSPSVTSTPTATHTVTSTPTPTITDTPTDTPTVTDTPTDTPMIAPTDTPTETPTTTPTPLTIVEDNDRQVQFEGWRGVSDPNANGGAYRMSKKKNDRVTLRFDGSDVTWLTVHGPDQGKARILIDGVNLGIIDLYNPTVQWNAQHTFSGLADKSHTLVVRVLGTKGASSKDTNVVVDEFDVGGAATLANDPSVQYNSWIGVSEPNASGGTYRYSIKKGAVASLTFTGTSIDWVTALGPAYGQAQVFIDGMSCGTVDLYAPSQQWQVKKSYTVLGAGAHTIRIQVLGTKNVAATGKAVLVDAFSGPIVSALGPVSSPGRCQGERSGWLWLIPFGFVTTWTTRPQAEPCPSRGCK